MRAQLPAWRVQRQALLQASDCGRLLPARVLGVVAGFGARSYLLGFDALADHLRDSV